LYGRDKVYVIADDDTLIEKTVSVVSSDRDSIILAGGINVGERVAVSPLRGAENGDKVSPSDPLTPTSGEGSDEKNALSSTTTGPGANR